LGASREIEPEYTATDLEEGDLILLCTDGLTNAVTDGEIKEIANKTGTLEEKVNALITYANERGGDDNVTAVLIKI
jgi:protein phosphatase